MAIVRAYLLVYPGAWRCEQAAPVDEARAKGEELSLRWRASPWRH